MAYNNSGPLDINHDGYTLGNYWFSIRVTPDPGESTTGINVRCYNNKTGEMARVASEVTGTVESWSVEANETEASVYVTVNGAQFRYNANPGDVVAHIAGDSERPGHYFDRTFTLIGNSPAYSAGAVTTPTSRPDGRTLTSPLAISDKPDGVWMHCEDVARPDYNHDQKTATPIQYQGRTYYYNSFYGLIMFDPVQYASIPDAVMAILPSLVSKTEENKLVARFAIDLHDAGGTGTDSDWHDPGDWDEERDPEDPPTTLRLNITGASAGTHSGTPSAPAPQQTYGSGGNGGNGGGGGAGASTIIASKFATDRADSKEITATARGPGAGSSGGPGGTGGDGCILIFY